MIAEYFEWLCSKIATKRINIYGKLLRFLFEIPFIPIMPMDENRAADGEYLRYIFAEEKGYHQAEVAYYIDGDKCTILEMMVALADKIEGIMSDIDSDRTYLWFWDMIKSLSLTPYTNDYFDEDEVEYILDRFNNKQYDSSGHGGLFTVPDYDGDLRSLEIWDQMQLYLQDKE